MLDPLTIERMEAVSKGRPIIVALSGGGDSTALLLLLAERFGSPRLHAVVVDHAIREGSAADAQRARMVADKFDVASEIKTLAWPTTAARSQHAARERRYVALCAAARACGAGVIALGHNADDQAETVLMRAAAGSTWRGLAGMAAFAPAPLWPEGRDLRIARPLLKQRRANLRTLLSDQAIAWIEDPANANEAFERVRVRRRLMELEAERFDAMRLTRLAERLRAHADALDAEAAALVASAAVFCDDRILIARVPWQGSSEVRRRAMSALVAAAAGAAREARPDAIARLDASMAAEDFRGATLAGARIQNEGAQLILDRDRGALEGRADGVAPLPPLALPGSVETVWDGRIALIASADGVTVYPDAPAPRLSVSGEQERPIQVTSRWLLADRVAHALNAPAAWLAPQQSVTNEINTSKG